MSGQPPPPPGRGERASWCLYDFANSAFTTVVVTFVYARYFTEAMAPSETVGTARWSWAVGLSAILVALLSPVLGAVADTGFGKKRSVLLATVVCIGCTAALAFVPAGEWVAALALFVVANVGFELGVVFNNAFLPELAAPGRIGRLSGQAWGLGYFGGLLCLVGALFMVTGMPASGGWNIRATNLLVAVWFLLFSLPFFILVRDRGTRMLAAGESSVRAAFSQLAGTVRRLRHYRQVALFLVARLVYNDGLVTIFAFGAIYAGAVFGMTQGEILVFAIVINVGAGLGAVYFGRQDDRIGAKATILISLVGLLVACVLAIAAPSLPRPKAWLYVAGILIGLMVGPNQSASRSLMGRFVPERHHAEFFGFYAFSGKLTAFVGPLALGAVTGLTGSHRLGLATLLPLFAGGLALLLLVNEEKGIRAARTPGDLPPGEAR